MRIKVKVEGLEGVMQVLSRMKTTVRNKVLRKALTEATGPMLKSAKAHCPKRTGTLRKSLAKKVKAYRASGVVVALVGPKRGMKVQVGTKRDGKPIYERPEFIAHLIEGGTKHSAAQPFLRPAFEENKEKAITTIIRRVREELEKEAAKGKGKK